MSLTASQLNDEAQRYEAYASKLREAAKIRAKLEGENGAAPAPAPRASSVNGKIIPAGLREKELKDYLRTHSGLTVGEIVNGSGIARGTVRGLLNRKKDVFERDRLGRWRLKGQPANQSGEPADK